MRIQRFILLSLLCFASLAPRSFAQDLPEDPRERFMGIQAKRIARHPYFSKVVFEKVTPKEGYVFYVQRGAIASPDGVPKVVGELLPWFAELEKLFIERYVQPNALERAHGGAPHTTYVLTSRGDYDNYMSYAGEVCSSYVGGSYDPYLSALVTFRDNFGLTFRPGQKRRHQLHAFVHSLQQAYGIGKDRLPGPEWFVEGMAVYLSMTPASKPEDLRVPKLLPLLLDHAVETQQVGGLTNFALLPLEQLLAPDGRTSFRKDYRERREDYWKYMGTLAIQCGMLVQFLNEADGGLKRAAFDTYAKHALTGRGAGSKTAAAAFGDLKELDKKFWEFLFAQYKETHPKFNAKRVEAARPVAGTKPITAAALPQFLPEYLALESTENEALLGIALWKAQQGRLAPAIAQLDAILQQGESAQATIERKRLADLLELRDSYFAHLIETGTKLRLEYEGKKLMAVATRLEEGIVHFAENRRGIEQLPVESLNLVELCSTMSREKPKFGDPLVRAYPLALAGDKRLVKRLSRIDDDGGLKADAEALIGYIALGEVARHISALASYSVDEIDSTSSITIIEHIKAVIPHINFMDFVGVRKARLEAFAALAYETRLEAQTIESLLEGKVDRLGNERLRITYDFSDPAQLDDFVQDLDFKKAHREVLPPTGIAESDEYCLVRGNRLTFHGRASLQHPLFFQGPQSVEYTFRYDSIPLGASGTLSSLMVGMCSDGQSSGVYNFNFGGLYAYDEQSGHQTEVDLTAGNGYYQHVDYRFQLVHDGTNMTWYLNGQSKGSIACGPLNSGEMFVLVHSNFPIAMKTLILEGTVTVSGTDRLRANWVKRKARALFR